ncbi:hypothetical protein [Clostridium sp.]
MDEQKKQSNSIIPEYIIGTQFIIVVLKDFEPIYLDIDIPGG